MTGSPRSSIDGRRGAWRGSRAGRLALLALFALAALPPFAGPAAAAASPAELRREAQGVLADGRFQREAPAAVAPERGESSSPGGGGPERVALPAAGIPVLGRAVLWTLLAAALLLLLLWIGQSFALRRRAPAAPEPEGEKPAEPAAEPLPGDPAALAAEGRYGEAVHALLLAAIALLARRFRLPLPPSRTSRELLRALPLQGPAREAFAGLVRTVERSWFGGEPVGAADYEESLARFRAVQGRDA